MVTIDSIHEPAHALTIRSASGAAPESEEVSIETAGAFSSNDSVVSPLNMPSRSPLSIRRRVTSISPEAFCSESSSWSSCLPCSNASRISTSVGTRFSSVARPTARSSAVETTACSSGVRSRTSRIRSIVVMILDRRDRTRLAQAASLIGLPRWSRDGRTPGSRGFSRASNPGPI